MTKLRVDVWSDIACPWCYVGKRRLEAALAQFDHRDRVEVIWRSFELDASAPRELGSTVPYADRLASKYRVARHQAEAMIDRMTTVAAADGLELRFDRVKAGNTFDAHRVLHLARQHGKQDAVKERFLRAYFTEGEPIGRADALVRLAANAGLDAEEVRGALAGDAFGDDVREDESEATELGITGVPFFVLGGRYAVSGAQPAEVVLHALRRAWNDLSSRHIVDVAPSADACGPEGCEVPQR